MIHALLFAIIFNICSKNWAGQIKHIFLGHHFPNPGGWGRKSLSVWRGGEGPGGQGGPREQTLCSDECHLCARDGMREDWLEQTLQGPPPATPPYPTPRDSASHPPQFQPLWDLTINAFSGKEWEFSYRQNSQTETLHMAFLIFTKPYTGEEWRLGLMGSSATFGKPAGFTFRIR